MIQKGNTIIYKAEHEMMSYWLCDIQGDALIFFNWYANPQKAIISDFWKMSKTWFNEKVQEGTLEVYDSLPQDKYGDIFEKQAIERNKG